MTSDQRTSLAIIIRLRLVFLRLASSCSATHVAILILHLIGPFMHPDIPLMSFYTFLFDLETLWLLISLKSVKFNSAPFKTPTESSRQPIPRIQLFPAWHPLTLRYFVFFFWTFCHCVSIPCNLICLLLSHSPPFFQGALEGFTKTAICQGHRLHFAICCKIKLGEVVYLPLYVLSVPSNIFPLTSGHTRTNKDRGRETDKERWKEMK